MSWWEGGYWAQDCLGFLGHSSRLRYTQMISPAATSWDPAAPACRALSIRRFPGLHKGRQPPLLPLRRWGNWGTARYSGSCQLTLVNNRLLLCFSCWKYQLTADTSEKIPLRLTCLDSSNETKLLSCMCSSIILYWLAQSYSCPRMSKHSADIKAQIKQRVESCLWNLWDSMTLMQHIF